MNKKTAIKRLKENPLDRQRWIDAGKSLGWKTIVADDGIEAKDVWYVQWHRFIDHLAEGKDIESFFDKLD